MVSEPICVQRCWDRWLKPDLLRRPTVYNHNVVTLNTDTTVSIWSLQPHSICWCIMVCVCLSVFVSLSLYIYVHTVGVCVCLCTFVLLVHVPEYLVDSISVHKCICSTMVKGLIVLPSETSKSMTNDRLQKFKNSQTHREKQTEGRVGKRRGCGTRGRELKVRKHKQWMHANSNRIFSYHIWEKHFNHSMNFMNLLHYKNQRCPTEQ